MAKTLATKSEDSLFPFFKKGTRFEPSRIPLVYQLFVGFRKGKVVQLRRSRKDGLLGESK